MLHAYVAVIVCEIDICNVGGQECYIILTHVNTIIYTISDNSCNIIIIYHTYTLTLLIIYLVLFSLFYIAMVLGVTTIVCPLYNVPISRCLSHFQN